MESIVNKRPIDIMVFPRYVRRTNPEEEILIFVAGSCYQEGKPEAYAGCAFDHHGELLPDMAKISSVRGHPPTAMDGFVLFPLEEKGPKGDVYAKTPQRAQLRAVTAVLQCTSKWNSPLLISKV